MFLSWPMVFANLFQNGLSMFEIYLVGNLGVSALAAFAIGGTVLVFFWTFQGGAVTGCVATASRLNGEKNYEKLNRSIINMLLFGLLCGVSYAVMIFMFMKPVIIFFGGKGETYALAKEYITVLLPAIIALSVTFIFIGILRGVGDSRTPLKIVSLMVVVNIIAAPLLVLGPGPLPALGIKGAAFATLISFFSGCAAGFIIFIRGIHKLRLEPGNLKIDPEIIDRFTRITVPAMGQGLAMNVGNVMLLKMVSLYGDPAIAAFGIWQKLIFVVMMLGWPIGNSGGVIVGYHIGINIKHRIKETVKTGVASYLWITVIFFIVFFFFAEPVMRIFTDNMEVVRHGTVFLKVITPTFVIMGSALIVHGAFNGAGSTHIPTIINFISFIFLQLGLAFILIEFTELGVAGIPAAIASAFTLQGALTFLAYKKGRWIKEKI